MEFNFHYVFEIDDSSIIGIKVARCIKLSTFSIWCRLDGCGGVISFEIILTESITITQISSTSLRHIPLKEKSHIYSYVSQQTMWVTCPIKCMVTGEFCLGWLLFYLWLPLNVGHSHKHSSGESCMK